MKLAILGTDEDIVDLAEAARSGGHAVVWVGDVRPEDAAVLGQLAPGVPPAADWESLLGQGLADAVLVGRGTAAAECRAEQLKRLVSDAVPLLVVHPVGNSVLPYYELDMNRREVHAVLRHYNPLVAAPVVRELAELVRRGGDEIGTVHQVVCQRFVDDCRRDAVLGHLARDAELLRTLAGEIRTVSAVGPRSVDATYASLQAQMTLAGPATVRWSVVPSASPPSHAEVTLVGQWGTRAVRLPAADWNAAQAAIDGLTVATAASGSHASEAASTWQDATSAMEIVDAISLSLEKGRTIEVHPQRLTHELAFRGTMSALGCGLLLVGLLVVGLAGVLGDLVGVRLVRAWPWALAIVLSMFLLLQVVPWLAKGRSTPPAESEPADAESG